MNFLLNSHWVEICGRLTGYCLLHCRWQAWAALWDSLDSLMRSALIVVGDVSHDGAAKVILRQEDEVVQALPSKTSHEPLHVGLCVGSAVGDRHTFEFQDLCQPQIQGTAIGLSRFAGLRLPNWPKILSLSWTRKRGTDSSAGRARST